jgi:general secretion pathway protein G
MNALTARRNRGFTLIELLVVMGIIAVLAAILLPNLAGKTEDAKIKAAKADLSTIRGALSVFEIDNDRFPTTEEGLAALVTKPAADLPNWKHKYLQTTQPSPVDPWGHPFVYRCPGTGGNDYDLFSTGPSGREGDADNIQE